MKGRAKECVVPTRFCNFPLGIGGSNEGEMLKADKPLASLLLVKIKYSGRLSGGAF